MKSTRLLLFISLFFLINNVANATLDSLKSEFNSSEIAEQKFLLAYEIAKKTIASQPDTCIKYLNIAIRDSASNPFSENLAKCLNSVGVYFYYKSKFDSTIIYATKALKIHLHNKDSANTISPRKNIALSKRNQGNYNEALNEFFEILDFYKSSNNSARIAATLNDIGNTYSFLKNYEHGNKYQKEALQVLTKINSPRLEGNVYNSLAYNFEQLGNIDSATINYEKSLALKIKGGNVYSIINTRSNLCSLIDFKTKPEECEACLLALLEDQKKVDDKLGIARTYINLAVQYSFYEDCTKAIATFESAAFYLKTTNDIFLKQHYFSHYSDALFKCGNFETAYAYKDSLSVLNDSIYVLEKQKEMLELDTRYQTQQKNESIKKLETEKSLASVKIEKQRWRILFLFLLIISIIGGAVFLVLYVKQRQEKLRDLALVKMREAERVRIARDMHDEIGSGLTRISLISEQVKLQTDTDAKNEKDNVSKIITQSRLLSKNLKEIIWAIDPSNDKLSEMLFYFRDYIYDFSANTSIECSIDFPEELEEVELASELRRNLFLILKEALNNVAKHAEAQNVTISFIESNGIGEFKIKDDGKGFNPEIVKKGMGLESMKSRIEKLDGSFELESEEGLGTSIRIANIRLNTTKV